mmetsp:Transcript_22815/g.48502  ORF Transcript_22815/g.48502 Transcript_22815/m.48502 type:complete len:300 (+) Transcript_22815:2949-3848(+)
MEGASGFAPVAAGVVAVDAAVVAVVAIVFALGVVGAAVVVVVAISVLVASLFLVSGRFLLAAGSGIVGGSILVQNPFLVDGILVVVPVFADHGCSARCRTGRPVATDQIQPTEFLGGLMQIAPVQTNRLSLVHVLEFVVVRIGVHNATVGTVLILLESLAHLFLRSELSSRQSGKRVEMVYVWMATVFGSAGRNLLGLLARLLAFFGFHDGLLCFLLFLLAFDLLFFRSDTSLLLGFFESRALSLLAGSLFELLGVGGVFGCSGGALNLRRGGRQFHGFEASGRSAFGLGRRARNGSRG